MTPSHVRLSSNIDDTSGRHQHPDQAARAGRILCPRGFLSFLLFTSEIDRRWSHPWFDYGNVGFYGFLLHCIILLEIVQVQTQGDGMGRTGLLGVRIWIGPTRLINHGSSISR